MTAKDEIAHANRLTANEWVEILCDMGSFSGEYLVLRKLGLPVSRWLQNNLTDVYVQTQ